MLELTGKNIEAKLTEKEREIQLLRQRESVNTDAIQNLSDQLIRITAKVQEMKKAAKLIFLKTFFGSFGASQLSRRNTCHPLPMYKSNFEH